MAMSRSLGGTWLIKRPPMAIVPRDLLQPGDHAQGGGLAAARGADQDDELPIRDVQGEIVDGDEAAFVDLVTWESSTLAMGRCARPGL